MDDQEMDSAAAQRKEDLAAADADADAAIAAVTGNVADSGKNTRIKTSRIWLHFSDPVLDIKKKLVCFCRHCGKSYAGNVGVSGTSTMLNHVDRCKLNPDNDEDVNQKKLCFVKDDEGSSVTCWKFNQNAARLALARMLVLDELPFLFVEGDGFREFLAVICPMFHVPSRSTSTRDVYDLFDVERSRMHDYFVKSSPRICLTTDTWTSVQQINYMCLTAHFIDDDWRLNKRIINFCPISSHKGEDIGKAVETCLHDWGIKNIMTVTVDNASANDTAIAYLKRKFQGNSILSGKFMHMRCIAHIINLIVGDGIGMLGISVERVRFAVRYVKQSPNRIERFKECAKSCGVDTKSMLCLDVPTRWNSTYLMLLHACKFEKVFEKFEDVDPAYKHEMLNRNRKGFEHVKLGLLCDDDWNNIKFVMEFLQHFYELTIRVSGSRYTTSNLILDEISDTFTVLKNATLSADCDMSLMAEKMIEKYNKYWGDGNRTNLLIFIATIFDPRHKLKFVHYVVDQLYSSNASEVYALIVAALNGIFDEYSVLVSSVTSTSSTSSQPTPPVVETVKPKKYLMAAAFKQLQSSSHTTNAKSELEKYLNEDLELVEDGFDILCFWKNHSARFPVISRMAKDILAIPISTVSSESAFSTGGRVLNDFRSSLTPRIVECLICTQDWIRRSSTPLKLDEYLNQIEAIDEDLEEYIKMKEAEKEKIAKKLRELEKEKEMQVAKGKGK